NGKHPELTGWRRLAIAPANFTGTDGDGTLILKWKGLEKVVETEKYAYFFISDHSAFILPKRLFAKEEEFGNFVQAARQFKAMIDESKPEARAASEQIQSAQTHVHTTTSRP